MGESTLVDRLRRIFLISTASAVVAGSPAHAAENYTVRYQGAPAELADTLKKLTNLSMERRPYPTAAAIRRIGRTDVEIISTALTAAGYYAASVNFEIEDGSDANEKLKAIFQIAPGPKFRIVEHIIVFEDTGDSARPVSFDAVNLTVDERSDGAALQQNQQAFLAALWAKGYPGARIVARRADARISEGTAQAFYTFESGPHAAFGEIVLAGNKRTDNDFIEKLKTWEDGDVFDRSRLVAYRDRLAATGLFTSINVEPGAPDADGAAPVLTTLEERKRRTVGAGLSYSTSEGPGGRLFLEYRNMFRQGERARVELKGSEIAQSVTLDLDKPLPNFPGSAYGSLAFTNETTDAFKARSLTLSGGIAKKWLEDRLETRGGLALETSNVAPESIVNPDLKDARIYFVSAPLSATWNTEDDPLILSSGVKATLSATPYTGSDSFIRTEANARTRIEFGNEGRFTLAARTRIATTFGTSFASLPVNKRIYSGGGSSVRGYDYQAIGALDVDGTPIGGRSAFETAIEARARIVGKFQIAAFADAGTVSENSLPDFNGEYFIGAGGGLRYLSAVGPIRLDIALPLEKRPTDSNFQLYISLGQPF